MIEIRAVGGYDEVGRNMTAINVDNEVIILDMGLELEQYIQLAEDEDIVDIKLADLEKVDAVPQTESIEEWRSKVKAIVPTHAHLDHIGAVPFLAYKYNAPIICTPFTQEVIKSILHDEKIHIPNKIRTLYANSKLKISEKITLEFIHVTHSTPQAVIAAIHTPYGKILYANDFKFDLYPVVGKKPNFKRLEELGKEGDVLCLITESTYAHDARKMPSESVARQMLKDIMLGTYSQDKSVIVTTFASHIARLKSIVEFSHKMDRKCVLLGRSFAKYVGAAERAGIVKLSDKCEILNYRAQINRKLAKIMKEGKEKYVLVVTGHQGEPRATLSRMARGETPLELTNEDQVIFSCNTIPVETNIKQREHLEALLSEHGTRIFVDIHASGHAAREDLRDLLLLTKPKNIVPTHGEKKQKEALRDLAHQLGYEDKQIHILHNGKGLKLQ